MMLSSECIAQMEGWRTKHHATRDECSAARTLHGTMGDVIKIVLQNILLAVKGHISPTFKELKTAGKKTNVSIAQPR